MNFALKRPCKDCPFVVDTSMVLAPGRMEDIAESLRDDYQVFPCHKTTHALAADEAEGEQEESEDDEGEGYAWHGREQACPGALAYTLREYGMLPVMGRIALIRGELSLDEIRANFERIEAAGRWKAER